MKPLGRHPIKKLTTTGVRSLTVPGRYADGNGLYLVVDPSGAKRWVLRTVIHGKRTDIGLGGLSLVSLAQAREEAEKMRRIARDGGDPIAERRIQRQVIPTFEGVARQVHAEQLPSWKNPKHGDQWINTLIHYVFPVFGDKTIDRIDTSDVLRALTPIWLGKAETARRVRQRIELVLDWAKAHKLRSGDNPAENIAAVLPKQSNGVTHHAALSFAEIPAFISTLRESNSEALTKLAFEFLILTACRTNEVLCSAWSEFDLNNAIWTIPALRMKAKREHRVPLSHRCVEILNRAKEIGGDSPFVFSSLNNRDKPMSNMIFLKVLKRMRLDITAHGFRSSFRDWASEQTHYSREVCEMALAHTISDKVEAAYRRGDLFEKRRELMEAWANFATSTQISSSSVDVE